MKILISPAKSLDFKSEIETFSCSQPKFLKQAEVINNVLKEKSPSDLKNLQNISEKLADLNWTRNKIRQTSKKCVEFGRRKNKK